ncbi:MAG: glycine cleavage system protein GcvH [Bacteroidales bacterium]|jgi:glycine cleavage system H protein
MNIPKELKYTKDHEWVRIEGENAVVGITDYAQGELGDIVFIEVETEGDDVEQGEVFGTIEAVKTVSDLFMPVSGKVLEVNESLQDSPDLINTDPFGDGWIIKIKPEDASQFEGLLNSEKYKELISS